MAAPRFFLWEAPSPAKTGLGGKRLFAGMCRKWTGRAQYVAWLVSRDVAELAGSDEGLHHFRYSRHVTQTLCS